MYKKLIGCIKITELRDILTGFYKENCKQDIPKTYNANGWRLQRIIVGSHKYTISCRYMK